MRTVRVFETDWDSGQRHYQTDWTEVSEEEYELLSKWYNVEVLKDVHSYLKEARERQRKQEEETLKYLEREKARKERAAKAAKTRKEKLLAKLREELESESNP